MINPTAAPSHTDLPTRTSPPRSAGARVVSAAQAAVFTGVWITLGLVFQLEQSLYIVLGVPLVLGFQLFIRRRPVRHLWVRDGDPLRLGRRARTIAVVLGIYPMIALAITVSRGQWVMALTAACCLPGAIAAGYAFTSLDYAKWRPALRAAALAAVIGLGWMIYMILPAVPADASLGSAVMRGLQSLLLYVPVCFILEEVSFRGAIDAHVHHPGESHGWLTAVFVATLWALWHLPIDIGSEPLGDLIITLLVIHITIGVPLSYAWRRSGNLALPAAMHAVIDAVRDGLLATL